MKIAIGHIIRIKKKKDIYLNIHYAPGWDFEMDNYCNREFKIKGISKIENNKPLWVKLENIPFYVWHVDWLLDIKENYNLPEDLFEI